MPKFGLGNPLGVFQKYGEHKSPPTDEGSEQQHSPMTDSFFHLKLPRVQLPSFSVPYFGKDKSTSEEDGGSGEPSSNDFSTEDSDIDEDSGDAPEVLRSSTENEPDKPRSFVPNFGLFGGVEAPETQDKEERRAGHRRRTKNLSRPSLETQNSLIMDSLEKEKRVKNRLRAVMDSIPHPPSPSEIMQSTAALLHASQHPLDNSAVSFDGLTGDVVVLGGFRGSFLRDANSHRLLWITMKAGGRLRKVDLSIGLTDADEDRVEDRVISDEMITHVGPVDIGRKLIRKLQYQADRSKGELRVHVFGYDWRLSGHRASQKLKQYLSELPCNLPDSRRKGALVIAHSMGGLITHNVVCSNPELFRGTVYAGSPFGGCPSILGPVRHGDGVLLNPNILNAETNFSMRSSFLFLPLDGRCFVDRVSGTAVDLDYFDWKVWVYFNLGPGTEQVTLTEQERKEVESKLVIEQSDHVIRRNDEISKSKHREGSSVPAHGAAPQNENVAEDMLVRGGGVIGPSMKSPHQGTAHHQPVRAEETENRPAIVKKYLMETLRNARVFKEDFRYRTGVNYPPMAILYSNSTLSIRGARVDGVEGIKAGQYSDYIMTPGDGVVPAKSCFLPQGFIENGHVVATLKVNRGHVSLLSDLKSVKLCIDKVLDASKDR